MPSQSEWSLDPIDLGFRCGACDVFALFDESLSLFDDDLQPAAASSSIYLLVNMHALVQSTHASMHVSIHEPSQFDIQAPVGSCPS